MGAKPSTANGAQSPRTRAFSTSSSSEVVTAPGFRFMRSLGMDMSNDRQRARSLSSVPDLHASHEAISIPATGASFDVSTGASPETDSSSAEEAGSILGSTAANIALGRVYAAHSLPSHIWSLNGIKCPVCSKFVIPDDIECHLVMCLTKPRLSYNEDVLTDDKGEECVICLEELSQGEVIARLPCLCIYHKTLAEDVECRLCLEDDEVVEHILCTCPAGERIRYSVFGKEELLPEDLNKFSPNKMYRSVV